MAVVIRHFGENKYAYWVHRIGARVVHSYLGPAKDPSVQSRIKRLSSSHNIPPALRYLFWDTNPAKINTKKHARYILERILEFGNLRAISWASQVYPGSMILETAETSRSISAPSKNFWRIWFGETGAAP